MEIKDSKEYLAKMNKVPEAYLNYHLSTQSNREKAIFDEIPKLVNFLNSQVTLEAPDLFKVKHQCMKCEDIHKALPKIRIFSLRRKDDFYHMDFFWLFPCQGIL